MIVNQANRDPRREVEALEVGLQTLSASFLTQPMEYLMTAPAGAFEEEEEDSSEAMSSLKTVWEIVRECLSE